MGKSFNFEKATGLLSLGLVLLACEGLQSSSQQGTETQKELVRFVMDMPEMPDQYVTMQDYILQIDKLNKYQLDWWYADDSFEELLSEISLDWVGDSANNARASIYAKKCDNDGHDYLREIIVGRYVPKAEWSQIYRKLETLGVLEADDSILGVDIYEILRSTQYEAASQTGGFETTQTVYPEGSVQKVKFRAYNDPATDDFLVTETLAYVAYELEFHCKDTVYAT